MRVVVAKFGGSLLAGPEDIKTCAREVLGLLREGFQPVVVVSAMRGTTDYLRDLARQISPSPYPREMDVLLTVGERVAMSLFAMALRDLGLVGVSYTGSQVGIITDDNYGEARIREIRPARLLGALEAGAVPVIAGFQGVSHTKEITTLGRGGSDLTAVALAAALGGSPVYLYKDVGAVYTGDPKRVPEARPLPELSYSEAQALSWAGGGVVHGRALCVAERWRVKIYVRGIEEGTGTLIGDFIESPGPKAVSALRVSVGPKPGRRPIAMLEGRWLTRDPRGELALVSVVGTGMDAPELMETVMEATRELGGELIGLLVSPHSLSVLVRWELGHRLEALLHRKLGLDKPSHGP